MSKRPQQRKIVITFSGRDPGDPLQLLRAVEEVFRPKEVVIRVEDSAPSDAPRAVPDEQLETKVREDVARALEEKDRAIRQGEVKVVAAPVTAANKRSALMCSIAKWVVRGARLTARLVHGARVVAGVARDAQEVARVVDDLLR